MPDNPSQRAREMLARFVHPKVFTDGWPLHLDDVLRAIDTARAEAFEEAALVAMRVMDRGGYPPEAREFAVAIRALATEARDGG